MSGGLLMMRGLVEALALWLIIARPVSGVEWSGVECGLVEELSSGWSTRVMTGTR